MHASLLARLSAITPEEETLLAGRTLDKTAYAAGPSFVVDSDKLLPGRLLQVRTHTRFVEFPDHTHNYVELVYMCRGRTTHIIDHADTVVLEEGDLLLMGPRSSHRILPAGREDIAINIMIRPEFFSRTMDWMQTENVLRSFLVDVLRRGSGRTQMLHFRVAEALPVQNLVENLILLSLGDAGDTDEALLSMTLGLLFTQLLKYADRLETDGQERDGSALVMAALHYIEEHYRDASLSVLADQLHQPLYRLSRLIKAETGLTFKELLRQKRFTSAVHLLTGTDLPVGAVIEAVGYENTSFFYRKFREQYHLSPQEYRRRLTDAAP